MQRITVFTRFDITKTGIIRRYNPLMLKTDNSIKTEKDWQKAKNQQSNFETLLQIFSLRAQPTVIQNPTVILKNKERWWTFVVSTEFNNVYLEDGDVLGLLKDDCNNVPLINKLNSDIKDNYIRVDKNTYFEVSNEDE